LQDIRSGKTTEHGQVNLHALNAGLVGLLALRLHGRAERRAWSILAAPLLYAVHPAQVAFISGRFDLLLTTWLLLALLSDHPPAPPGCVAAGRGRRLIRFAGGRWRCSHANRLTRRSRFRCGLWAGRTRRGSSTNCQSQRGPAPPWG